MALSCDVESSAISSTVMFASLFNAKLFKLFIYCILSSAIDLI